MKLCSTFCFYGNYSFGKLFLNHITIRHIHNTLVLHVTDRYLVIANNYFCTGRYSTAENIPRSEIPAFKHMCI